MGVSLPSPAVGLSLFPSPLPEVSVYVHVPFCSSRCNYCDFYFETSRSPRVIRTTLDRIVEEAEFFCERMGRPRVRSLSFGGGTPSVVPPELLDSFLSRLRSVLFADTAPAPLPPAAAPPLRPGRPRRAAAEPDPLASPGGPHQALPGSGGIEWSFEANPESITPELLAVLRRHGCNRLSLGVQSFQDTLLAALTRRADRRTVLAALERISAAKGGALRLNVDLMTGIPGQTKRMVREDIDRAIDFAVDHFSVYSLTVEEHTPLRQAVERGIRRLPPRDVQDALWLDAREAITAKGFEWYEISNFALPGCRSTHNLGYWRSEPYLGLGPGGVSTIPMQGAAGGASFPVRLTNPNLFIYGSRLDRFWHHEVERLKPAALLFEQFMTGLRTSEGVPFRRIEALFALDLPSLWGEHLAAWVDEGIADERAMRATDPALLLTPGARLLLDRHLIAIEGWIDELGPLPSPKWPLLSSAPLGCGPPGTSAAAENATHPLPTGLPPARA